MPIRGHFGPRSPIFPGFLCLICVFVCPCPGTERILRYDGRVAPVLLPETCHYRPLWAAKKGVQRAGGRLPRRNISGTLVFMVGYFPAGREPSREGYAHPGPFWPPITHFSGIFVSHLRFRMSLSWNGAHFTI